MSCVSFLTVTVCQHQHSFLLDGVCALSFLYDTLLTPCVFVHPVIIHLSVGNHTMDEEDFQHVMYYVFTDLPVQIQVVTPTGLSASMGGHPICMAMKVTLITPHTQETGLMTRQGARRVLGLQNKPEVCHSDTCIIISLIACNDHLH